MKRLALAAALLLAACGTAQQDPVVVDKAVPVSCVKQTPAKPDYATDKLGPNPTEFEKVQAIILDWLAYRGYVPKLEAGLEACK